MKLRTGFLIIVLLPLALVAARRNLDPRLTQFALDQAVIDSRSDFLKKSDAGLMLRVVITIQGDVNELRTAGAKVICRRGNIVVADIPASSLERLSELPAVLYIEAPFPDKIQLDKSTAAIHAVSARTQSGLSGKGVIVGIIDSGIDWKHPDFRMASGETRIQYLLDLSQAGPVYGGMLYTASQINGALLGDGFVDADDISGHGSHVAGIAAGDGSETAVYGAYAGVAPAADLVVVKATRDGEGKEFLIADQMIALSFIDSVAELSGKPYVANLSFGGHNGAHDGSSATERFIDALVGPGISGKAVVTVAGNDGDKAVHAQSAVNSGGSSVSFDVARYTAYPGANNDLIVIGGWYDGAQRIGVKLQTPDGRTFGPVLPGNLLDESSEEGSIYIWNGFYEGEGGYRAGVNPFNGDREFYIQISDESSLPADGEWQVIFNGAGGLVDMWIANTTMDVVFNVGKQDKGTLAVPGTCKNAITVASFVSKLTWRDLDNNNLTFDSKGTTKEGQLSLFSSCGPVRKGGYLKPEIAAPGQILVSVYSSSASASSMYSIFNSGDTRYPNALVNQDGDHGLSSGTSMAAPHVAGAIALLFEQNPALTSQQIKEMLFISTTKDAFVGSVPNADWGWGRLDVLKALSISPVDDTPREFLLLPARPNPFSNQTEIIYEIPSLTDADAVELAIYNSIGQRVRMLLNERMSAGRHNIFWDGRADEGEAAGSGVYFLRLQMGSWKSIEKVVYLGSF